MASFIERRKFLATLGGVAAAWPLAARAQQGARQRRVGILLAFAESDDEYQGRVAAFRQEIRRLGWPEESLRIDERWPADDMKRVRADASELITLKPDAILVGGRRALSVLQEQTRSIPEHPRGQDTYHDGGTLATTEFGSLLGDLMMRRQAHRGADGWQS